jgi:flagellar hook-associated protein 1 FlgK
MATIFNALNIGYSGLKSSQVAIDTTGHNIANAENPDYSRQRTVITASTPLHTVPGDVGLGANVTEIVRIHDEFTFKRLKDASSNKEYNQFRQDTMDEVASYFPEIDQNGVYAVMQDYFDAWNDFSKNTDDPSLKINLAEKTKTFADDLGNTYDRVEKVQIALDQELGLAVDEINRLGKEIADINKEINRNEAGGNHANDLRDQRDKLELALAKLVDISVSKGGMKSDMTIDRDLFESGDDYHLNIGGASFVDGGTFHPLVFKEAGEGSRFNNIYYRRQDYVDFDISDFIHGGKVGAILSLRGSHYDENMGKFTNGEIQSVLDRLDSYASSMIINTNNVYASHATTRMDGNYEFLTTQSIANQQLPINDGQFTLKVYDADGKVVAERTIDVNREHPDGFEAIREQINDDTIDDNGDNIDGNDVNDFLTATIQSENNKGTFHIAMDSQKAAQGYTFSLEEVDPKNPTNFAGVLGLQRFFDGWSENTFYHGTASKISLNSPLDVNPTKIAGNKPPVDGDNQLANQMLQLQYDKVDFYGDDKENVYSHETLGSFFRGSVTELSAVTASIHANNDTSDALLTAVTNEYDSITKVDIDEELTNLIKYQTGYSAAAKVITTVDQMIQTLLGIKQ